MGGLEVGLLLLAADELDAALSERSFEFECEVEVEGPAGESSLPALIPTAAVVAVANDPFLVSLPLPLILFPLIPSRLFKKFSFIIFNLSSTSSRLVNIGPRVGDVDNNAAAAAARALSSSLEVAIAAEPTLSPGTRAAIIGRGRGGEGEVV
jgi:hypothetical protein